jgi:hypothetical protein
LSSLKVNEKEDYRKCVQKAKYFIESSKQIGDIKNE